MPSSKPDTRALPLSLRPADPSSLAVIGGAVVPNPEGYRPYRPPQNLMEVLQQVDFDLALEPDDPRNVATEEARGSHKTFVRLRKKLGLGEEPTQFYPPEKKHLLFFGHTGSGKTTELKKVAAQLAKSGRYFVVEVDVLHDLDRNNLHYPDVLLATARHLLLRLGEQNFSLPASGLEKLEAWFSERVLTSDEAKEYTAETKAGIEIGGGIPALVKLLAGFTAAIKGNSTHKDSLRKVVRNTYTHFAEAFNALITAAEEALEVAYDQTVRVLFVIDGTDKLNGEDTKSFFVLDTEQLLAIRALAVYTAPIYLKYGCSFDRGKQDADLVLPMMKVWERDGSPCEVGRAALRDILLKRADHSLFHSEAEVDRLVEHSGGHPRELLRLLRLCCEFSETQVIDAAVVEQAIASLAADFRMFVERDDYALLVKIDQELWHEGNDKRTCDLLYNLVLLEYNDGSWRRSHPVVRTLKAYQDAERALAEAAGSASA